VFRLWTGVSATLGRVAERPGADVFTGLRREKTMAEFLDQDGKKLERGIYILHMADGNQYWVAWLGDTTAVRNSLVPQFVALNNAPAGLTGPIKRIEKVL
jgi:hypothetical protein